MYPSRVDEKGRLKLPAGFQKYFADLAEHEEKRLFVTSTNRRTAQVYTMKTWRSNLALLATYPDPDEAGALAFNANDLGSEAEMDNQGRILFSPELRRELGVENQPVRVYAYRGHIEVISEQTYEERKLAAAGKTAGAQRNLESAGLQ